MTSTRHGTFGDQPAGEFKFATTAVLPPARSRPARDRTRLVGFADALTLLPIVVLFAAGAYLILAKPPVAWVDLIFDDAYYYLGIARSLAEGHGSQFLPPFETNGYQPLWLVLLWLSATLFGTSDASLALQLYALSFLLTFAFCILSKRVYRYVFPAALTALLFPSVTLAGMETALLPPLVIAYVATTNWKWRGLVGTLIALTRLDALALIVAFDVVAAARRNLDLRHYAIIVPVFAAYLGINTAVFGTPLPVSGLVKAAGNIPGENYFAAIAYAKSLKYAVLIGAIMLTVAAVARVPLRFCYGREILALLLAQLGCALYYSANSGWPIWGWYFWPAFLITFFLFLELIEVVNAIPPGLGTARRAVVALSLASISLLALPPAAFSYPRLAATLDSENLRTRYPSFGKENVALVEAFKARNVPPSTYFAMGDRAGSFGFFLGPAYNFFHTEGLVGPYRYYTAMKADQAGAFASALPIKYLVVDRERLLQDGPVLGVIEPVQGVSARMGPFLLCFTDEAVEFTQRYLDQSRNVFDFEKRRECPQALIDRFADLRSHPGQVRHFSLPSEYDKWYLPGFVPPW